MPVHSTAGGSSIFFAKSPDFSLLCSVVCQLEKPSNVGLDLLGGSNSSAGIHTQSKGISRDANKDKIGHSNIMKCRELIFTESNILASPSLQEEGSIYVIITSEFWESGKLQERCVKMNLQVGRPIKVIPAVFQACFSYTLKAKLAPLWNKVGDCYVQGRDFITNTGILGAIHLEINVTDGEICLAIKPQTVKIPHCTLQDFGICGPIINHFLVDTNYIISGYIEDKLCYVLPSMKQGQVINLMHNLPSSSPFKSYSDLRKYWKNTYGYRLPESGEGIVYIDICFPGIPHTFTYPEFCIRKVEPRPIPRVDSTPVLQAFLTDIKKKMPHMCHIPLEVTRKPQYTAVTMNSAIEYVESGGYSSMTLINRNSTLPQRIPARSLIPVSEYGNILPHVSPYRPLSGHQTNIKSATGYVIKTPQNISPNVTPPLPPSHFGYPHDGILSKDGRQQLQHIASPQRPLPYGSNTRVTPSRHHCHNHQSPSQSPYAAKSTPAMPMGSPGQQALFCTPPHYTPPAHTGAFPVAHQLTPASAQVPGRKELLQPAPKSARNLNHTIFSLAAELRNQSGQDISNSPEHVCMPAYRKAISRHVGSAGEANNMSQPLQMHGITENIHHRGNDGGFTRKEQPTPHHYPAPAASAPFVPIFNPKPPRSFPAVADANQTPQGPKIKPQFTPHKPRSVKPSTFMSRAHATPTQNPTTIPSVIDLTSFDDVIPPTQPTLQHPQVHLPHASVLQHQEYCPPSCTTPRPPARQALHFGPSEVSSFKPVGTMSKTDHPLVAAATSSTNHAKKRKAKESEDSGEVKKSKPRSKPKIQENMDVQLMAQNDQLSKVNSITLVAWLKEKNINVSSKDKKLDLITKVMTFINCSSKEM